MQNQDPRSSDSKKSTRTPVAEVESPFKIELRIEGVPQDAVPKVQETMSKIQELVVKLRTGYQTESTKRTFRELGNIELYELGDNSKTVRCPACLKYALRDFLITIMVYALNALTGTEKKD